ncbi:MAG: DnaT-like ssDNA-binding protein [Gemmatimonadota bacterium]
MPTIISTPGASNANSYLTVVEADAYYDTRVPGVVFDAWDGADSKEALLINATRMLDKLLLPDVKELFYQNGVAYYRVHPAWTGLPATTVQRLCWPRSSMFDQNGNAIGTNVIPEDLKFATAEFAGQLGVADRQLDNDVVLQGLKSVKAGSVALSFDTAGLSVSYVIPAAVYNLLVPSWYTNETYEPAQVSIFGVITQDSL